MVETTSVRQEWGALTSTEVDLRGLCFAVSAKLKNFLSSAAHKITHMASLFPTAQPTIVDLPAPATHTEGDYFELVCTFTGIPAPKICWEKDGSVFLFGEGRRIVNSTGRSRLEINSLALSDAGVYNCSVSNVVGMDASSVRLEVRGEVVRSS